MAISKEFSEILSLARTKGIEAEFISAMEAEGISLKSLSDTSQNNDLDLSFQLGDPQDFMFEQYWEGIINN